MSDIIIGADEVARGSLISSALVCAVIAPAEWTLDGLRDSKKLSAKKREALHQQILECAPFVRPILAWVPLEEIDRIGVGRAVLNGFRSAVLEALALEPGARVVLDGDIRLEGIEHESFPKADDLVPAVSAASVFAKVERDRLVQGELHRQYPQYGWDRNSGYGTAEHLKALDEFGPCPLHRMSFSPVFRRSGFKRLEDSAPRNPGLR